MSKYGAERLANVMADSILDFVSSSIDNQLDNLDLSDKAEEAVAEAAGNIDFADYIGDFDWSNVIDRDLIAQNIDLESVFQDWLESKFEKQIQPALDSMSEDLGNQIAALRIALESTKKPSMGQWVKNLFGALKRKLGGQK